MSSVSWWAAARVAVLVALAGLVAACSTRQVAPVEERPAVSPRPAPGVAKPAPTAPGAPPAAAAEAEARPQTYTVKRGDTLHQIALDNGLDYRELAAWNNIENVNLIRVGQVLRLTAPGEGPVVAEGPAAVTTAPLRGSAPAGEARPPATTPAPGPVTPPPAPPAQARNTESYKTQPKAIKEPWSAQAARDFAKLDAANVARAEPTPAAPPPPAPAASSSPAASPSVAAPARAEPAPAPAPAPAATASANDGDDESLDWMWPAKGKVLAGFSDTANLKGVDIGGAPGTPVVASAPGKVVYAGSGLRGYGKLVIIKHNKTYLSAYAHNREILVKEGQQVTRGQKIAEMGSTDTDTVKLHFEIRRLGKPMDPIKYLPPA